MKSISIILVSLFCGNITVFAQFLEKAPTDRIIEFFANLPSVQQEKLYLQLDKPYYAAGEKIWFKGYLLNSSTHVPDMPDNFIYLELLSQDKKIVCRQKIKKREGGFWGNLSLPTDLVAGEYALRSYTNWMRNNDSEFFYNRNISIANSLNESKHPVGQFEKNTKANDFSVSFFPEGGHLLAGFRQQIAYKCQQSNGYSGILEGYVISQAGDTLTKIKSEHDGMGAFSLLPEKDILYYALVSSPGCGEKKIKIPIVEDSGVTLALNQSAGKIRYQILSASMETSVSDSLYLIAHTRGILRFLQPLNKESNTGIIDLSYFQEGITHFLLMDHRGNILSERLLFIYPEKEISWHVQTDKEKYGRREKVKMSIKPENALKSPIKGSFSISITDNQSVLSASLADNIYSDLLVVSDLKGYIENPGWYFKEKSRKTLRGLDLLMLTHGWTRFEVKPFASQPYTPPLFFVEKGQFISGKIKNIWGKDAKGAGIIVADPANDVVRALEADENGAFLLDGIDYQDSTTFVIQARNKKGLAFVDIEMDEETIPKVEYKNLFPDSLFIFNSDFLFSAAEAGIQVVHLEDVVIEGKRNSQQSKEIAERVWADYSMTESMLDKSLLRTAKDLFRHAMGGANIDNANPLVVVDGMCCWDDNYILDTLFPEDIKSFYVYKDQKRCQYGSMSKSSPAVVITLRPEAMARRRKGIALFHSLGYVEPDDFYHQAYDTPEKKESGEMDVRSTIYWNPNLKVDSTGCTEIEFYTSDHPSFYHMILEGISESGQIYRYAGDIVK